MRIMGVPAFRNRSANPYNALLYTALARAGAEVEEATVWNLLRTRHDVVHLHWPEYLFTAPTLARAFFQSLGFIVLLAWLRARQTRIVWTVHNLAAHEPRHRRLEARMWRWFVARVDGFIALTAGGRAAAVDRFPELADRPGFVIPHGHYRGEYPDVVTRGEARTALGIPHHARVVCFFGAIRAYKDVPGLIEVFRAIPDPDWRLIVAGKPSADDLRAQIRHHAGGDPRIRLALAAVPIDRVQLYLHAADLVVLPYREVLNSGTALLGLSFGRPVLVPERGAMAELRELVGNAWIRTYDGELSARTLLDAMAWVAATPRDEVPPLDNLAWHAIARETLLAFETVRQVPASMPQVRFSARATE